VREPPASKNTNTEGEEVALLKAVTRRQSVKKEQIEKI
jgi:hypothetical protein